MDGSKVKFVKFGRRTKLYALDSEGRVWAQIGPDEWETVVKNKEDTVFVITKGLSSHELAQIIHIPGTRY